MCRNTEIFTGRVVYWPAADCAMVARKSGSMVRVTDGAFYAIITEPSKPLVIDDAIDVTGSTATAAPQAPALLSPSAAPEPSSAPSPYPPGLD